MLQWWAWTLIVLGVLLLILFVWWTIASIES